MKRLIILFVIQILFWGSLSAQRITEFSEYDFLFEKRPFGRLFSDTLKKPNLDNAFTLSNPFQSDPKKKILTRNDSIYFKKLPLKELNAKRDGLSNVEFKYTLPAKPLFYISLWDYSPKPMLDKRSLFYNPLERKSRDSQDLRYLWSGDITHFRETGYSGNYPGQQKPVYKIYFVRNGKKIKGFGIELLDDDR